ncbi:hypothetical protein [Streptomyces sp. SAJ15]|uniref:hypothetical protein n=1 Tax=Streptomyces sp. SAJ15 TaxID=2011095 RepID=UPI0021B17D71|nr:hypothetical protein [Streptomyces sp. SAJ15]
MHTTRLKGRVAATASVAVLAIALTACGSDSDKAGGGNSTGGDKVGPAAGNALSALQNVSEHTRKQNSAKVEGTTQMGPATTSMKGQMDWSDGMRATMTIIQTGGAVSGTPMDKKPMEARYTPDAMFVNLGDALAADPKAGGKHWMKYDYATLAKQAGASGKFLQDQMQNTDPARAVQLLVATGKVKSMGEEKVRGIDTTHYTGTVKVADLAKMQSKDLTEQDLKSLQEQLQQAGMETETIDVWVDENDLLLKKRERADSTSGAYDSTVYYTDYGTDVSVEEPPAGDTMNFEDALPQS